VPYWLLDAFSSQEPARDSSAEQPPSLANETNQFRALLTALRWFRNWGIVWRYRARPWDLPPLRLRRGFILHHRPKDLPLLQIAEVLAGKCYRICMDEPRSGTIIDIGANIGLATLDWATRLQGVRVHAYEPHPETYEMLVVNIEENRLSRRVTAHEQAVGRSKGTVILHTSGVSVNNSAYGTGWLGDARGALMVPLVSFDEVVARCDGPIGLVKIDAEGAETDILEGASTAALARARRFVIEVHDSFVPDSLARCERVLVRAGFHCVDSDPWRAGLGILYAVRKASELRPKPVSRETRSESPSPPGIGYPGDEGGGRTGTDLAA
jgi:FkbM family methyltransferase